MFYIKRRSRWLAPAVSVVVAIVFVLVIHIPVAQAETPYDITACYSGTITMLSQSKELTIFSMDIKGIARSNHENKVFDNCTFNCVAVVRITAGKRTGLGYCKFLDPDGDIVVFEVTYVGAEGTSKFLHGTGKWKGITGSGKFRTIARGKPITKGTAQNCSRATGTIELPKK